MHSSQCLGCCVSGDSKQWTDLAAVFPELRALQSTAPPLCPYSVCSSCCYTGSSVILRTLRTHGTKNTYYVSLYKKSLLTPAPTHRRFWGFSGLCGQRKQICMVLEAEGT